MPNNPGGVPLDRDQIDTLLAGSRSKGPRQDPTEPRDVTTWFKLSHTIRDGGCENEECLDPREELDRGRNIVALVKGKHMCRYCYLNKWLSVE